MSIFDRVISHLRVSINHSKPMDNRLGLLIYGFKRLAVLISFLSPNNLDLNALKPFTFFNRDIIELLGTTILSVNLG